MGKWKFSFKQKFLVMMCCMFLLPSAGNSLAQTYDLTGYWESNDGAVYRFRQVDNKLFWTVDHRPTVINVFYGIIAGETITGSWADVPGGNRQGNGTIALRIESNERIIKISESGKYGGTFWQRVGEPVTTGATQSPGTGSPSSSPPEEGNPCGKFAGCWAMRWKKGNGGTFSFYKAAPDRCEYEEVDAGGGNRHWGTMTIKPDPNKPTHIYFTLEDSKTQNNNNCTFNGLFFGEVVEDCNITCTNGWTSWCSDFKRQQNQSLCEGYGLRVGEGHSDLVPLYDTVPGLGNWWMVYGADNWHGIWTRRNDSNIFDGEWRKGKAIVKTVTRIERTGDSVKAARLESSDGYRCAFEGMIKGTRVEGTYRCAAPGGDYGRPAPFKAVMHE
jgi:hypothetical protein